MKRAKYMIGGACAALGLAGLLAAALSVRAHGKVDEPGPAVEEQVRLEHGERRIRDWTTRAQMRVDRLEQLKVEKSERLDSQKFDLFEEAICLQHPMAEFPEGSLGMDGSISEENMRHIESIADRWAPKFLSSADDLEDTIRVYEQFEGIVPPLVFKPQTIMPNRSVSGLIVYDTGDIDEKEEGEFNAVISIDGEEHMFVFSRSM